MNIKEAMYFMHTKLKKSFNDYEMNMVKTIEIFSHILKKDITYEQFVVEMVGKNISLSLEEIDELNRIMRMMIDEHMPVPYIIGKKTFLDKNLIMSQPILIPRVETEFWCFHMSERLKNLYGIDYPLTIIDLGTGTGCIALHCGSVFKNSKIYAIDIDAAALDLAKKNGKNLHITNIEWIQSDWFENLKNLRAELIISNPPYVSENEWNTIVDRSVTDWESKTALVADEDGLHHIKTIIEEAPRFLYSSKAGIHPQLWIEIGYKQSKKVIDLFITRGYADVAVMNDMAGIPRAIYGTWKHNKL